MVAVEELRPLFAGAGHAVPKVRVACGFPSVKALSPKKRAIGECWDASTSEDNVAQISISPLLSEASGPGGVLAVLVHELVHAVVGCKCGHRGDFIKVSKKVGLVAPWTATRANDTLEMQLADVAKKLGDYPHSPLHPLFKTVKRQSTRMQKAECGTCGYTVRLTQKWISVGPPHCPLHGAMEIEQKGEDENED